jgi:dolichyl-diphosphooligosaccharide--protein glycosyltransferase
MAWWDYGYQITGIGERTTIADGNTWNHEHIATLGRCLVSPEEEAHSIVRHLADYVLVWVGGGGDDLAKSPHMARISNSVYSDICPGDPTCRQFGFIDRDRTPKPMMAASLLYKLHSHNQRPGVKVNPDLFEEVYVNVVSNVVKTLTLNIYIYQRSNAHSSTGTPQSTTRFVSTKFWT